MQTAQPRRHHRHPLVSSRIFWPWLWGARIAVDDGNGEDDRRACRWIEDSPCFNDLTGYGGSNSSILLQSSSPPPQCRSRSRISQSGFMANIVDLVRSKSRSRASRANGLGSETPAQSSTGGRGVGGEEESLCWNTVGVFFFGYKLGMQDLPRVTVGTGYP